MDRFATVEMSLVLGFSAGVALVLLVGLMGATLVGMRARLSELHGLSADGLIGQARSRVPQPLAGSAFEILVQALDRGDQAKAIGAFQRLLRGVGGFHLTGGLLLALGTPALAALPLLPAAAAHVAWLTASGGPPAAPGVLASLAVTAALFPLAATAATLALHLHRFEAGRRTSAAAGLLQHAGKELR
ncbi:MAG: hypothetical protein QGH45_16695 [Myxococcota bacterium]|nr:hypothetical protein [Myxococcota bacterium]